MTVVSVWDGVWICETTGKCLSSCGLRHFTVNCGCPCRTAKLHLPHVGTGIFLCYTCPGNTDSQVPGTKTDARMKKPSEHSSLTSKPDRDSLNLDKSTLYHHRFVNGSSRLILQGPSRATAVAAAQLFHLEETDSFTDSPTPPNRCCTGNYSHACGRSASMVWILWILCIAMRAWCLFMSHGP